MISGFLKIFRERTVLPVLGVLALAACSPAMTAHLETGKQARKDGDFATAEKHLQPLSDFGLPEAQYELAMVLLKKPDATDAQKAQARDLMIRLSEGGNEQVNFELGRYFAEVKDYNNAAHYFTKAAEGGNDKAYMELARIYRDQGNADQSALYYTKAGEAGNAKAYFELAAIEEKKKNFPAALDLYKKSFDGQYYRSAMRIARLYEKGMDGEPDLSEALRWYQAAEKEGVEGAAEKISDIQSSKIAQ